MIKSYVVSTGKYRQEILQLLSEVLDSGVFVLGEKTSEFEKQLAADHSKSFGVAVCSDTAALEAALVCHSKKIGVVVMPDTSFFGCANVVLRMGIKVVPIPVSISNGIMPTVEDVVKGCEWARTIHPNVAYMAVYTGGTVGVDSLEAIEWCLKNDVYVVEDCAHCHGATYTNGALVGSAKGAVSTFSFYATKLIHSGEGGIVLLDDKKMYERLVAYRNYGKKWGVDEDPIFADLSILGYNWRMTEFQAAIGLCLWRHLNEISEERRKVELVYDRYFKGQKEIYRLGVSGDKKQLTPNLYRYIVIADKIRSREDNRKLYSLLKERGVVLQAKCNSLPLTETPLFKGMLSVPPYYDTYSSEASKYSLSHLCLPIYPSLGEENAECIAETLMDAYKKL